MHSSFLFSHCTELLFTNSPKISSTAPKSTLVTFCISSQASDRPRKWFFTFDDNWRHQVLALWLGTAGCGGWAVGEWDKSSAGGSQALSVLEEGDEEPLEPPDVSLYDHTGIGSHSFLWFSPFLLWLPVCGMRPLARVPLPFAHVPTGEPQLLCNTYTFSEIKYRPVHLHTKCMLSWLAYIFEGALILPWDADQALVPHKL